MDESRKAISYVWGRRGKESSGKHGRNWPPKLGTLVEEQVTLQAVQKKGKLS